MVLVDLDLFLHGGLVVLELGHLGLRGGQGHLQLVHPRLQLVHGINEVAQLVHAVDHRHRVLLGVHVGLAEGVALHLGRPEARLEARRCALRILDLLVQAVNGQFQVLHLDFQAPVVLGEGVLLLQQHHAVVLRRLEAVAHVLKVALGLDQIGIAVFQLLLQALHATPRPLQAVPRVVQ